MKFKNFILASLCSGLFVQGLEANMVSLNPRPRSQSMGGVGMASRGDKDSAIMNPAGLNDVEASTAQALPILFEVPFDLDLLSSALDYNDVRDSNASTTEKRNELEKFLSKASSSAEAMRFNFYPSYTKKNFHVGLIVDAFFDPRLRLGGVTSDQVAEFSASNITTGFYVGGSYAFLEDRLQVGMTLKPLYQMAILKQNELRFIDVAEGMDPGQNIANQIVGPDGDRLNERGYGIGVDLGVKYKLPFYEERLKPMVALTYQDIGNTRFVSDHALPKDIPQSISLGAAIHPDWKFLRNVFEINLRNITDESAFLNKLHVGAETVLWNLLAFRVGLNQAYFTGGAGLITKYFELDAYVTRREAGKFAHIQDITTVGCRISGAF